VATAEQASPAVRRALASARRSQTNVQTSSGPVCATTANGVSEWLGIAPGGDSELVSTDQLAMAHGCQFWDRVSPKP
jgi:hypothetical protein